MRYDPPGGRGVVRIIRSTTIKKGLYTIALSFTIRLLVHGKRLFKPLFQPVEKCLLLLDLKGPLPLPITNHFLFQNKIPGAFPHCTELLAYLGQPGKIFPGIQHLRLLPL